MKTSLICCLIVTFIFFNACDEDKEKIVYDIGFEFSVKDNTGNDLLNPENINSFTASQIKLFYLKDGSLEEVYDKNLDYPRNFFIYAHDDTYRIRVFLNNAHEKAVTYIKWNESQTDVIAAKIYKRNSLVSRDSVWLNDKLIWKASDNTEPYYEITL